MSNHYDWSTRAVDAAPAAEFAAALQAALNDLEHEEYEIDDIMDAPGGRDISGVVVIAKRPKRFPRTG